MVVVHEGAAVYGISKPVICPKCNRGRIGSIPNWSRAGISRRGRPPNNEQNDCVLVKCAICGAYWMLTIE